MRSLLIAYRCWWPFLSGVRLVVRAVVEMAPKWPLWPAGMVARSVIHWVIAAPWWSLIVVLAAVVDPVPVWVGVVVGAVLHLLVLVVPGAEPLRSWWRAIEFHRRWPRVFNGYAGRTNQLQAMTGGEFQVSVPWRPVVDHPRLSWLAVPVPGGVEYAVSAPPDRAISTLTEGLDAFCSAVEFVDRIEIDADSAGSSFGVMRVLFTPVRVCEPRPGRRRLSRLARRVPAGPARQVVGVDVDEPSDTGSAVELPGRRVA